MVDFDKVRLDKEERELEDSFERGEWKSVESLDAEMERYRDYARSSSNRTADESASRKDSTVPAAD